MISNKIIYLILYINLQFSIVLRKVSSITRQREKNHDLYFCDYFLPLLPFYACIYLP